MAGRASGGGSSRPGLASVAWRWGAVRSVAALLAVVAAIASGGAARATADGPDHFRVRGVSPSSALNLRAAPSIDAPRVARIPPGASCLRNLGCRGGLSLDEFATLPEAQKRRRAEENPRWCKVEYRGSVGWVVGRYLAEAPCRSTASP